MAGQPIAAPDCEVHHPGVQHSALLAQALWTRGRLRRLVTRLQYGAGARSKVLQAAMAHPGSAGLLRFRTHSGLPDHVIDRRGMGGLVLERVAVRSPLSNEKTSRLARALFRRFAEVAARAVDAETRFVLCTDHAARWSFEHLRVRRPDIVRVLDVAHPFAAAASQYVLEDAAEHGFPLAHYDDDVLDAETVSEARLELELADHILAASSFTVSTLVEAGADRSKVSIVPYGFDTVHRRGSGDDVRSEPSEELRLLFVGALSERKGISMLLRTMRDCERIGVPVRLQIIGRTAAGYPAPDLSGLDRCEYLGAVSREELADAYALAHYVVLPSICEGFGQVLVEALAAGAGVVTTERSAGPDLLQAHPGAPIVVTPVAQRAGLATVFGELHETVAANGLDTAAARQVAGTYTKDRYADRLDEILIRLATP